MGSGKSTWMINQINQNPDKQYLIVVPLLDEVDRYEAAITNVKVIKPNYIKHSKLEHVKKLIGSGKNIVTTHQLIRKIDTECMELLHEQNYTLVIDEALEVIEKYKISQSDIKMILNNGYVSIDDTGYVNWNSDNEEAAQYKGEWANEIKNLCELRSLMAYKRKDNSIASLIWNFPSQFFKYFPESYILTYLWNGNLQQSYFQLHNIQYNHMTLVNDELQPFSLTHELTERQKYKDLITIVEHDKLNAIGKKIGKSMPLSKGWYDSRRNTESIKILRNNLQNYFNNIIKSTSSTNMWGTFKTYQSKLKGNRYTGSKKNICFVEINARGTNNFRNKSTLAYMIDIYCDPYIVNFFEQYDIKVNQDLYALSQLLQWIWRSQIRDMKPITLYLPSERMRNLLVNYFNV